MEPLLTPILRLSIPAYSSKFVDLCFPPWLERFHRAIEAYGHALVATSDALGSVVYVICLNLSSIIILAKWWPFIISSIIYLLS